MLITAEERLGRARIVLEQGGRVAFDLLAPAIAESWQRCLAAELDPCCPPLMEEDGAPLPAAREQHELIGRLAVAEMQNLYQQIAGSNFMIAFCGPDGMLLDAITDTSFQPSASRSAIQPGSVWTELRRGTNALGTCIETGRPVTVHGGEHFFRNYVGLTCTAHPVFSPGGPLAGVLDASSDCRSRQRHTQALVGMAARQIENGLFRDYFCSRIVIAFHNRGEYLHTLSAGLLALDPDGRVRGANAQACFLLQGLPVAPGQHFDEIFRTRFATLIDSARKQERLALEDHVGSTVVALVENLCRLGARRVPAALMQGLTEAPDFVAPDFVAPDFVAPDFVADDPEMRRAVRLVEEAARRKLPTLIQGPTGTGKERLARHAHRASRRSGPFVPVNCAALPESLIEAELFGHAEGAFTGARRGGSRGLVREADGGTLFLDEIGDMKPTLQAILLRLLDDWTVRPIGGRRARPVDVYLVAATNTDLAEAMRDGRFRPDLYWRLNTVEVTLPPLAARKDFAAIVRHLLAAIAPGRELTDADLALLARHAWPGNIRELRGLLTRFCLGARDSLAELLRGAPDAPQAAAAPLAGRLQSSVRSHIVATHRESGGNVSETARRLGISRNRVYRAIT
jgi:sigma-54 dependent transcriptional regulator, acetoin dehydrogenase operon transcriptional activator AcoR